MARYDKTIKTIFSDMTEDLVRLMTGMKVKKKEELNIEFTKVEKRESDMVLKCEMDKEDIAVHIEFQSTNDSKMPYRMLRYCIEILEKHKLPVYQLVLYMGKEKLNMEDSVDYFFDVNNMLNYKYNIVDIGDLKFGSIVGNKAYSLYSLLPIVDRRKREREKEKYLAKCARAIKNTPIDIEEKREIAFRAEILAGLMFDKSVIENIFSEVINTLRIEDSVIYQDVIAKGMQKGVKKGLKEGKSKGKVELILKLLKKKFENLSKTYEDKLLKASEETIDKIAEDIFDIEKIEDLDTYFK